MKRKTLRKVKFYPSIDEGDFDMNFDFPAFNFTKPNPFNTKEEAKVEVIKKKGGGVRKNKNQKLF